MSASMQVGPRGGRYVTTASGKRVYLKDSAAPPAAATAAANDRGKPSADEQMNAAKQVIAQRIAQREKQKVLKTAVNPADVLKGRTAAPAPVVNQPQRQLSEVEQKIKALRVRRQVQEENRVFNAPKVEAAHAAVAQAATRLATIKGSDAHGSGVDLHAHRVNGYAEGRRWTVASWRDQKTETFTTPHAAAKRFVELVGHEHAHKAVAKAEAKYQADVRASHEEAAKPRGAWGRLKAWFDKRGIS